MTSPRWPFPQGCLLALVLAIALWAGAITIIFVFPAIVDTAVWALSLAMNIMGAK